MHIELTSLLSKGMRQTLVCGLIVLCVGKKAGHLPPKRQELKLLKFGAVAGTSPRSLMQNKSDNLSHVLLTCTYPSAVYVGAGGPEDGGRWGLGVVVVSESVGEELEEECLVFGGDYLLRSNA